MDLTQLNEIDKKLLILKSVNEERLGILKVENFKPSFNFNALSKISFTIHKAGNETIYNLLTSHRIIELQDICNFIIDDVEENSIEEYKNISCSSFEIDINRHSIAYLDGVYKFYDPTDINTIMGIVMSYLPNWTLVSVDSELWDIYRKIEVNNIGLYQFMMNDVENAYECVFEFDTINKTISVKAFDNIPSNTDIFISDKNVITELNITEKNEDLITALQVYGGGNLSINLVNPLGDTIYNFQHFLYTRDKETGLYLMPDSIRNLVIQWQSDIDTNQPIYANLLTARRGKLLELITLQSDLTTLQGQLKAKILVRDALLESTGSAVEVNVEIATIQSQITNKISQINSKQSEVDDIDEQLDNIQNLLKPQFYFTESEYLQLLPFMITGTFTDENLVIIDSDSETTKQDTAQELYNRGKRLLDKKSKMNYSFQTSLIDIISNKKYEVFKNQLKFGAIIIVDCGNGNIAKTMLLGIECEVNKNGVSYNYLFSDELKYHSNLIDFNDYLTTTTDGVINKVGNKAVSWGMYESSGDKSIVESLSKGLDMDRQTIVNAEGQEIVWDYSGLWGRKKLPSGLYDNKQWKFINNMLAFTDDGFNTIKTALGEVTLPDGTKSYGINTSAIMGKFIISNQLSIINEGKFTFDSSGAKLWNSTLEILAKAGNSKIFFDPVNGFKIQKKNGSVFEDMIYLDTNGEAYFKGNIFGGSININNRFKITPTGEVEMASGTLKSFQSLLATGKGLKVNNGNVIIDGNCEINGNLILGGSITWNTHDPLVYDAIDLADDANVVAQSASGNVQKLANGTYTGGTFITGKSIESPNIYGGKICGGEFRDLNENTKLVLNPTNISMKNADLNLYSGNNIAFQVYDYLTGVGLTCYGNEFLVITGQGTMASGVWNFSNANVTGITARFA